MKHFASIQQEFIKVVFLKKATILQWWLDLSFDEQVEYTKKHPETKLNPIKREKELEKLPTRQEQWHKEQRQHKIEQKEKELLKKELKEKRFSLFDERFNLKSLNNVSSKINDILYEMYKQLDPSSRLIFYKQINDYNSMIHNNNSNLKSKINSELSQQQDNSRDIINKLRRSKPQERSFEKHKLIDEEISKHVDRVNDINDYKAKLPSKHVMNTLNVDKLKQYEIDNKEPKNLENITSTYKDQLTTAIDELAKNTSFDTKMIPTTNTNELNAIFGIN